MESMRDIKRRIRSVQNTRQITKAMEMVAASKLRRAQESVVASRPYANKIREVIGSVAAGTRTFKHPMLQSRDVKRTGYLVITSDLGKAGGFNANVLRNLVQKIKERHASPDEYVLFVIGSKGRDFLKRRDYPIVGEVTGLSDSPEFADVKEIATRAVKMFADEEYDQLYLHYSRFVNVISQVPTEKQLLPLENIEGGQTERNIVYDYEPSEEEVLAELLPKYAETLIYNAVLESKAGEFGARMTAMKNASDNASELIDTLTLQFNRARQAAITQEISEIVAGANALS